MSQKSYYGRYTFHDASPLGFLGRTIWVCDSGLGPLGGCGATGEESNGEDACWAAHSHEREAHHSQLYPVDRS